MRRFFAAITIVFVLFGFAGCNTGKCKQNNARLLVGTWRYEMTQKKTNGEWINIPSLSASAGKMTLQADGCATLSMTFNDQTLSQAFNWELLENGDFLTDGKLLGKLVFEDKNKLYLCTDETFDPVTGEFLKGEFRDVYQRE